MRDSLDVFWEARSDSRQQFSSGGVTIVMCDASVRFVTETVDDGGNASSNVSGTHYAGNASRRGVWGAMATPSGGEVVSGQ